MKSVYSVHPLPSDLPLPEVLVVPIHPTGPSEFIAMSSNPANQPIEDQFLRWRSGDGGEVRGVGQTDGRIT